DGGGEGESELVEEVRVWRGQVEGDRVCPVAGDDPAREIAAAGSLLARPRAGDAGVDGRRAAHLAEAEDPLDCAPEILRPHRRPGGVPQAGAKVERVRQAVAGRGGGGLRKVRNEGGAERAG